MRKFFTILTALMICIALNFGLTDEAQAAEIDSSIEAGGSEVQELYGPPGHHRPPPHHDRWGRHRHHPPPPPPHRRHHDCYRDYPPPPPPPPPHHGRHDRW